MDESYNDTMQTLYTELEKEQSKHSKRKTAKMFGNILFAVVIILLAGGILSVTIQRASGQVPFLFGLSLQHVKTGSMSPTIEQGSIILCRKVNDKTIINADYDNGTIITFYDGKRDLVTHRVVEETTGDDSNCVYYITKGDANNVVDDYHVPRYDVVSYYIGKVF